MVRFGLFSKASTASRHYNTTKVHPIRVGIEKPKKFDFMYKCFISHFISNSLFTTKTRFFLSDLCHHLHSSICNKKITNSRAHSLITSLQKRILDNTFPTSFFCPDNLNIALIINKKGCGPEPGRAPVYIPCVSRIVAFIVKNINLIIFLHVSMVNLILHM
jgi:hypothetical protein